MTPHDLPKAEKLQHGTHARYVTGCRCADCRAGHCAYNKARYYAIKAGDWNGLVSAEKARSHLRWLSKNGVGRRSVAAACDVADTVLMRVLNGTKQRIQARTEKRILAVDLEARADYGKVSAKRVWRLIDEMLDEGFSKAELARRLGYASPAIQLRRDRVTARNERRVEKLYRQTMAIDPLAPIAHRGRARKLRPVHA